MEGTIVLCNDGILRFQSNSSGDKLVPLVLIQDFKKISPSRFFLNNISKEAIIEKGSTLSSFLLCLEPWAEVVSDITDRNVKAYIDEMRKPSSEEPVFDRIEIKKLLSIYRDVSFGTMPDDMDIIEWLNRPSKEITHSDTFKLECTFDICGYSAGEPGNYSMSHCSIHQMKNVPLVVDHVTYLMEYESRKKAPSPALNKKVMGVQCQEKTIFLKSKDDTSFSLLELISTVFEDGLFYEHPSSAVSESELIQERLQEVVEQEKVLSAKAKPSLSLVDNNDVNNSIVEDKSEDGEIKKVVIAEGAFAPLARHFNREKSEWESIMDGIEHNNRYPIRIGKVEQDAITDRRLQGIILKAETPKDDNPAV